MARTARGQRLLEILTVIAVFAAGIGVGANALSKIPDRAAAPDRPTRLLQTVAVWNTTRVDWDRFLRVLDPATGAETGTTLPSVCRGRSAVPSPSPAMGGASPTPTGSRR